MTILGFELASSSSPDCKEIITRQSKRLWAFIKTSIEPFVFEDDIVILSRDPDTDFYRAFLEWKELVSDAKAVVKHACGDYEGRWLSDAETHMKRIKDYVEAGPELEENDRLMIATEIEARSASIAPEPIFPEGDCEDKLYEMKQFVSKKVEPRIVSVVWKPWDLLEMEKVVFEGFDSVVGDSMACNEVDRFSRELGQISAEKDKLKSVIQEGTDLVNEVQNMFANYAISANLDAVSCEERGDEILRSTKLLISEVDEKNAKFRQMHQGPAVDGICDSIKAFALAQVRNLERAGRGFQSARNGLSNYGILRQSYSILKPMALVLAKSITTQYDAEKVAGQLVDNNWYILPQPRADAAGATIMELKARIADLLR